MKGATKLLALLAAVMLTFGSVQTAPAVLVAVSPGVEANGFPTWYQDSNGLVLDLCLSQTENPALSGNFICGLLPETGENVFDPAQPIVFGEAGEPGTNFPSEAFYYAAEIADTLPTGGDFLYIAALEAAFNQEVPMADQQTVFSRIRIRVDIPAAVVGGTYTVTHPYGVETFRNVNGGTRAINFTRDIGIAGPPPVFIGALNGDVGPFLQASATEGGPAAPIVIGLETFIGDPNVLQFVTGAPTGNNFVRINGPQLSNVTFNQFALLGRVFDQAASVPTPLVVDRTSYRCPATGACSVDVFAHATAASIVTVEDSDAGAPKFPKLQLIGDGNGLFYGTTRLAAGSAIPASVVVTATPPAPAAPASVASVVKDTVKINANTYNTRTNTLTVSAVSSDLRGPNVGGPRLSISAGLLTNAGTITVTNLLVPEAMTTVTSTAGGIASEAVALEGVADRLVVTASRYTPAAVPNPARWIVRGTAAAGARISIYLGDAIGGTLLGQVTADTLGAWVFNRPVGGAVPDIGVFTTISLESSAGGQVLGQPITQP